MGSFGPFSNNGGGDGFIAKLSATTGNVICEWSDASILSSYPYQPINQSNHKREGLRSFQGDLVGESSWQMNSKWDGSVSDKDDADADDALSVTGAMAVGGDYDDGVTCLATSPANDDILVSKQKSISP